MKRSLAVLVCLFGCFRVGAVTPVIVQEINCPEARLTAIRMRALNDIKVMCSRDAGMETYYCVRLDPENISCKLAYGPEPEATTAPVDFVAPGVSVSSETYPAPTFDGVAEYECSKGCACGNTCIDCAQTCQLYKLQPPAPVETPGPTLSPSNGPNCKTGCRCGNACISCAKSCSK